MTISAAATGIVLAEVSLFELYKVLDAITNKNIYE